MKCRVALGAGAMLAALLITGASVAAQPVVVGAKKFTESAVLAELMAQRLEEVLGIEVERRFHLAGTMVAFDALRSGGIDLYAEYTGTGLRDILADARPVSGAAEAFGRVSRVFAERFDVVWLAPFGFDNTYVLLMRAAHARRLGVQTISDLSAHRLRFGMTHEFLERKDGLPGLRLVYGLQLDSLAGMEHDLAYRALADATIDVTDGYSTDAKILTHDLAVLADDRRFFPPYEAAPLVRGELLRERPQVASALAALAGRIDDVTMRHLNAAVEAQRLAPADVARHHLAELALADADEVALARGESFWAVLWERRGETLRLTSWHLALTGMAELLACAFGIPVGIGVSRRPRLASLAIGAAGVLQTVPSIALLAFMLPIFGIGARPAVAALFLYGLLPVLRNTVIGLRGVDPLWLEVGDGLGMSRWQRLRLVELPLAGPVILAGVRTSTVINVGTATLGAFIGAGGLGEPIVTGLSVTDTNLILSGALPAAALALAVDAVLGWSSRRIVSRGLRLPSETK